MKLYYVPRTRAGRPRWLLEELGVPHELARVDVTKREQKSAEYLKVHALGHVPALTDGDMTMWESAAIVAYLADKYPDKGLAPAPGSTERGPYYQWLFYAMSELEPAVQLVSLHTRFLPEEKRVPSLAELGRRKFKDVTVALEQALEDDRPWILGEHFSAADVVIGSVLMWANFLGLVDAHPLLADYLKRATDRPAYQRSIAD